MRIKQIEEDLILVGLGEAQENVCYFYDIECLCTADYSISTDSLQESIMVAAVITHYVYDYVKEVMEDE